MKYIKLYEDYEGAEPLEEKPVETFSQDIIKNIIPTNRKIEVPDYPYGYSTKTTLYDSIEFNDRKGYRHVTQTINPKTGLPNKPKKSTYYPLLMRYMGTDGHIKTIAFSFNGDKEINKGCEFVSKIYTQLTPEEIEYLYILVLGMSKVDFKATVIYGGSNPEDLKEIYQEFWRKASEGLKNKTNVFGELKLDVEKIEASKPKDFNPFVTKRIEKPLSEW